MRRCALYVRIAYAGQDACFWHERYVLSVATHIMYVAILCIQTRPLRSHECVFTVYEYCMFDDVASVTALYSVLGGSV